jgi:hypothetical protein
MNSGEGQVRALDLHDAYQRAKRRVSDSNETSAFTTRLGGGRELSIQVSVVLRLASCRT